VRQRACSPCRRRKSKCQIDATNPSCLLCRLHGTRCVSSSPSRIANKASRVKKSTLRSSYGIEDPQETRSSGFRSNTQRPSSPETPFANTSNLSVGGETESHILGPLISDDAQWIATYLSNEPTVRASGLRSFPGDSTGKKPTIFNSIRRRPLGLINNQTTAFLKCQTVEKLIGPFCVDVVNLLVMFS
jgi:hypothetical protein